MITSVDSYRAYCLIIDRKSRYTWIFLTKTKTPPLQIISTFLKQHGTTQTTHRTICTNQGGELWASQDFKQVVMDAGYLLEPTGAGDPFQNGMAEHPNQTFGQMVQCMLHSSGLLSLALTHAGYLKNCLPHTAINTTPYQAYTGKRPATTHLKIFGCPVIIKNPGRCPTKLDMNTNSGRFLGYTTTDKNVYYLDNQTCHLKLATHCIFNEAGRALPPADHTPVIKALQQAGWPSTQQEPEPPQTEKTTTPILPSDELLIQ